MERKEEFSNKYVAETLRLIAAIYDIEKKSKFRIIAYQKAADTVEHLSREVYDVWQEGKLKELPGFGSSIGESMDELFKTGNSKHFDLVIANVPKSLPVLMRVPGIGPKKAYKIITTFQLLNADTIFADVLGLPEGKIAEIPLFGEKSEADIREAIQVYSTNSDSVERMPYPFALDIYRTVVAHLSSLKEIQRMDPMGSLRRKVATIGDVDIAVMVPKDNMKSVVERFITTPGILKVENAGEDKSSIIFPPHVRVDLRAQTEEQYGAMLQYFTGSKAHNIALRELALKQGLSLNEYGIKDVKTGELHKFSTEEEFYAFIGLDYVPPEIREGGKEIELAKKHTVPQLVQLNDIKGDFHMHSSYDITTSHDVGANTYEELVEKGVSLGYSYIGFADHNPRQSGLTSAEVTEIMKKRKEHIDKVLKGSKITYYIGLEVDILPSGEIALPDAAIDYVDYLVVSIHSSFNQTQEDQTKRVLKALSYPKVRIFGHPTGRMINKRSGVNLDWKQVFPFAAEKGIAMEINSSPHRLDLPDSLVKDGLAYGTKYIIDTDSHAAEEMDGMEYGIAVARRGWLEAKQVVNTWSPEEFRKWILNK